MLKVDADNVRMSEFVKQKLGFFNKGEVFYEFSQEEDLLSYKEIICVPQLLLEENLVSIIHTTLHTVNREIFVVDIFFVPDAKYKN